MQAAYHYAYIIASPCPLIQGEKTSPEAVRQNALALKGHAHCMPINACMTFQGLPEKITAFRSSRNDTRENRECFLKHSFTTLLKKCIFQK
jgi:hypothetical protein